MTHVSHIHAPLCLALALGAVAACEPGMEHLGAVATETRAVTCQVWECGANSAEINDIPIGELHVTPDQNTGLVSAWNIRIVDFVAPAGAPGGPGGYVLHAEDGYLWATNGADTIAGPGLKGSRIRLENVDNGDRISLHIHDHGVIDSWTAQPFAIDRYVLTSYDPALGEHTPVCTDADDTSQDSAWAVIVSGERYSWATKTVEASGQDARGWFNIACNDNGLYKMKLMGYDPQPGPGNPHVTTPLQRQATLKMLTADYCGTGASFTETGTSLHWYNAAGWADNGTPPSSDFEAYWSEGGALCLDAPRLGPDQISAIEDECATVGKVLPPCSEFAGAYEWGTEVPL